MGHNQKKFLIWIGLVSTIVIIAIGALFALKAITGRGFGIRNFARLQINTVKAIFDQQTVLQSSSNNFDNIIFLHHSVGHHLIEDGEVREQLTQKGFKFWDHHYNFLGLRDPEGNYTGYAYNVPNDNTDPDGLARIFNQREYSLPVNTLSGLLQLDVIVIKSCFPTSNITSDEKLETFKSYYIEIRDEMDEHPNKVFIIMTQPPLNPAETSSEDAARARKLADWLSSPEFLDGHLNVYTFNFFSYLAEGDPKSPDINMLRQEYRNGNDSHPNRLANETIGPIFVEFVVDAIDRYRTSYQSSGNSAEFIP